METKAEYVTDDPLGELMDEIENCAQDVALAVDWRFTTIAAVQTQAMKAAKAALREYVDALVKGGITAQIADLLEQVSALQERIESLEYTKDAYWQVIEAQTERIAELEKAIIESGIKVDLLKSELRERDE